MRINKIALLTLILLFSMVFFISSSAQRIVTIGTDPVDTGTYAATAGLSNIINMYNKAGIMLKVKPTTGPMETAGLLANEEIELLAQSQDNTQPTWLTKGDFQQYDTINKVTPTRLLFGSIFDYFSAFTIEGSGILTGADLKGKRYIGEFTGSPKSTRFALGFLANWGLTKDDVIWISIPGFGSSTDPLMEGKADACGEGGVAGGDMAELDAVKGVRFLGINTTPEAIKAYQDTYTMPISWAWIDPDPNLMGIEERQAMLVFRDYYMCNPNQISDEEAYAMVEALWDNMELVSQINVDFALFTEPEMLVIDMPMIPYHTGAIKFYKEKGIWTQALEDRQAELLALEAEEMK